MSIDQRRRQRKLERKAAKRRAALLEKRTATGHASGLFKYAHFEAAITAPIHECLVPANLFRIGIGNVVFSRRFGDGRIVFGAFLLDVFCLGVKDAVFAIMSNSEFYLRKSEMNRRASFIVRPPSYARKLVEDAVAYASALGFVPHPDYQVAKQIFGDVDASECHDVFVFGDKGKPHFIAGPHDSPARCQRIMSTLEARLGRNGFHYLIAINRADLDDLDFAGEED